MANQSPWRLWVRLISSDALDSYMRFRGLTNEALAIKAGDPKYRSTISHLRSGARKTCGPKIARAIEKALEAPPNSLFLAEVPTGAAASSRSRRSA